MRRRSFLATLLSGAAAALAVLLPRPANAALVGTWRLRCPKGDVDTVHDGTRQHQCCEHGDQVFQGNVVTVVCPNDHDNRIDTGSGGLRSFPCRTCGAECQGECGKKCGPDCKPKSSSPTKPDRPDHK